MIGASAGDAARRGGYDAQQRGYPMSVSEAFRRNNVRIVGQGDRTVVLAHGFALSVARLIWNADHRGDLAALTVPTLIVQAQEDVAVPVAVGEYLADRIPGARLAVIDGYGHLPHMSAPAAVNEALRQFLG
ncbi:alpha/beta fold hydrolase [Sorangium sp. So ce1128]